MTARFPWRTTGREPIRRHSPSSMRTPRSDSMRCMRRDTIPTLSASRSLSIVIPAYCESENILHTLENVTRALEPLAIAHEILVVDDGSTDGTADLVASNLARFPNVRVLVNERNMGFGWSYRRGVDAAALEHIVMVHGDNAWGW